MLKLDRRDWIALFTITALAALLRFYQLGVTPPGFQFDEAFNALDAARVLAGDRPLFLPMNGGREVFYTYFQVALASLLGLNLYTLRLASALAGILTVPAAYWLLRTMLTRDSRRVAALTSLVLAVSFWHLYFSHYGIRIIFMPLVFSGAVGFFWLGSRSGKLWPYLLSGVLAGLGVWNNPTGRLIPFVLIGFVAWLWWQHPEQRRLLRPSLSSPGSEGVQAGLSPLAGLLVTGLTAFLVFLPLGLEFLRHADFFFGHPEGVSIFAERVHGGSPLLALLGNILRVLGMFNVRGDALWTHNLAGRPVFDPLLSIPFLIGVAVWLRRLIFDRDDPDRDALLLLGLWSFVMLLPSVFSDMAPNYSRTLPSLPAVFVAAGLGLAWILAFAEKRNLRLAGPLAVAAILVISGGLAVRDYFLRFPQAPEVYYAFDVDKLEAFNHLQPLTSENQVGHDHRFGH